MDIILTLHPERGRGIKILRGKYELLRDYIISELKIHGETVFNELIDKAKHQFSDDFFGDVPWYLLMVKIDLEIRGVITSTLVFRERKLKLAINYEQFLKIA